MINQQTQRIAIIVLAWNNVVDTLECLSSLQRSGYNALDVILVDNGSTDGTVVATQEKFPAVHIIENRRNLGYAEGNNIGIRYALEQGYEFVFILNNDTLIDSATIESLVSTARSQPAAQVLCPKIYFHDPPTVIMFAGAKWDPDRAMFKYRGLGEEEKNQYVAMTTTETASGCAFFARASIWQQVGLFDPRFFLLWEETDWCSRVRHRGYEILFVPTAKVWHKTSRTIGSSSAQYAYYYMRNRLLWIEKNLNGKEKIRAFARCARETYWSIAESRRANQSPPDKSISRARLLAWWHYATRQFGFQKIAP